MVIVGGITAFVIGWQSWETRRSASAMERAVIASLRPQLKVPAIALIPGKLVEVDGVQTLQDDVNRAFEKDIPAARRALEIEFRKILGDEHA